jgi:hypothetical protein
MAGFEDSFAIDDQFTSGTDDPGIGEPRDAGFVINCTTARRGRPTSRSRRPRAG